MWVLYAVASILHAFLSAVYAHSYVYITSVALIVSYSIKSQSSELVHSFTKIVNRPITALVEKEKEKVVQITSRGRLVHRPKYLDD